MSPYPRGKTYTLRIPTVSGTVLRAAGTRNKPIAERMERMFEDLGLLPRSGVTR